ncbi:MAG TPA: flagellar hook-length control protein FliK, partial [Proteiniclasticum sp.]|nr:flagellar hook-length control protein FliK [Proteiniclasticum sp.]
FEKTFDNATEEIMKSMETIKEGGKTTMKVNLHPEELGKMEITLTMEDGKLSGKILLDNREIRQIFTERLEELSNTLKSNSIQIGKFEVGVGDRGEGNQGRQESKQQMQNPFRGYFNKKSENALYPVSPERDLKEINLLA